jgi:hypothetical protein
LGVLLALDESVDHDRFAIDDGTLSRLAGRG